MTASEFLVSYGRAGDFGCFHSEEPIDGIRGDRLVVRSHRGQELGQVMRPATLNHGLLLANRFSGQILRKATKGDEELAERMQRRSQKLFAEACRFLDQLDLPLAVLDAEVLLDGRQAILHAVRFAECDPRSLMDSLSERFRLHVSLHDPSMPVADDDHEQEGSACGGGMCGSQGCGSCASGGCSSCTSHAKPGQPAEQPRSALLAGVATHPTLAARIPLRSLEER